MTAPVDDIPVEFTVDAEMAEAVLVAYEYVYRKVTQENATLYIEVTVSPSSLGRTDLDGTADIIMVTPAEVEVVDYKNGFVFVDSKDNPQTQIYGRAGLDTLGISLVEPRRILRTTIIQPRALGDDKIRSTVYEHAEVQAFSQMILDKAIATDDPNAPLVPTEEACKYCICTLCPARAQKALEACQAVFTDLTQTTGAMVEQRMLAAPSSLQPAQVTMILENEPLIKGFLAAVHEHAVATLEGGGDVQGFKLVAGNKASHWNEKEDVLVPKLRRMKKQAKDGTSERVSFKDAHNTVLKSPAQIRTLLKSQLTEAAMKRVESWISTTTGKPQLAPASSSKPAINVKASQVFDNLVVPSFLL